MNLGAIGVLAIGFTVIGAYLVYCWILARREAQTVEALDTDWYDP